MATYEQIWALRYNSENLRRRTSVAVARAAFDVLNEPALTPNHVNRAQWAKAALRDAEAMTQRMFWGLVSNATIQASGEASSDGDIQFVINSLIDSVADGTWA